MGGNKFRGVVCLSIVHMSTTFSFSWELELKSSYEQISIYIALCPKVLRSDELSIGA